MCATQAQIDANRRNAHKSTGPRTPAGKAQSRRNSLQHGMTGNGVVIPQEDAAEVATRVEQFELELSPEGHATTNVLSQRAAMLTVRLERCLHYDDAMTLERVRNAAADFDEARRANADFLFDHIVQAPVTRYRELLATPEGVDRLLVALHSLQQCAIPGSWTAWIEMYGYDLDMYCGFRPGDLPETHCRLLSKAVATGNYDRLLEGDSGVPLEITERRHWAMDQLLRIINDQIAHLEAHRRTFDFARIAASRADAERRALISMSPDAVLFRRYEAASERALNRTLKQIADLKKDRANQQVDHVEAFEAMAANGRSMPEMAEFDPPSGSFRSGINSLSGQPFGSIISDPKSGNRQARRAQKSQERREATE